MERRSTALAQKAVKERRKSRDRGLVEPSASAVAGLASRLALSSQNVRLQDLCPEDKARIGELLKKLAEEKAQRMQSQELIDKERRNYEKRLKRLKKENAKVKGESQDLKDKFEKSLTLLKTYKEQAQRTDLSPVSVTSSEVSHDLPSQKFLSYSPEPSLPSSSEPSPQKDLPYTLRPSKAPLQLPTAVRPDSRSAYSQTTEDKGIQAEGDLSYSDFSKLEESSFGQKILYDTVSPQVESAVLSPPYELEQRSALDEVKSLKADINSLSASLMKLKGSSMSVSKPEYDSWKQSSPAFNQTRQDPSRQSFEPYYYPPSPPRTKKNPDRDEERVKRILERAEASTRRAQELMHDTPKRPHGLVPEVARTAHEHFHEPERDPRLRETAYGARRDLPQDFVGRREPTPEPVVRDSVPLRKTRLPSSIDVRMTSLWEASQEQSLTSSVSSSIRKRPFVEEEVPDFSHNFYDEALFDLVEDLEKTPPQQVDDRLIDLIDDMQDPRDSFEELRQRASQLKFVNF
jgi:hypothetical protein